MRRLSLMLAGVVVVVAPVLVGGRGGNGEDGEGGGKGLVGAAAGQYPP